MERGLVAVVVLAACGGGAGGDPDAPSAGTDATTDCGTTGAGVATGTIDGVEVAPVMRAFRVPSDQLDGEVPIALDDSPGPACGPHDSDGDHFLLIFCASPTVGEYRQDTPGCPGARVAGFVERAGGMDVAVSTSATVTISRADDRCIAGTYTTDFTYMGAELGTVTGWFAAVACP